MLQSIAPTRPHACVRVRATAAFYLDAPLTIRPLLDGVVAGRPNIGQGYPEEPRGFVLGDFSRNTQGPVSSIVVFDCELLDAVQEIYVVLVSFSHWLNSSIRNATAACPPP